MQSAPVFVSGSRVNARTQCAHYHSERDIIAIKHKCCDTFYACIKCHNEAASHPAQVWPRQEFSEPAVYCGNCHSTLSIEQYLACANKCPSCQAAFNPGCATHYHLYFEQ
ncbi:CHY zinc finger protein [Hymenobacter ginsengisoli]|uniref:CHY zinc finger protein n=1 Tax=Hymenobacter ginsengisoli TaxID=1051626 RepID=A0ABP8QSI9_9BACT|nr:MULTISPECIES: CHY zinc finger protein [unclassified Hymenobacter]MBO2033023.1 chromophore lyase [Hymenobacter sp. BT559]